MILCLVDDLMFSVKISSAAKAVNAHVVFERAPGAVLARVRNDRPSLVIVDLNSSRLQPLDAIRAIKGDRDLHNTRTLGYVSHVQADVIASARAAGCDEVLARSAFSEKLGEILARASTPQMLDVLAARRRIRRHVDVTPVRDSDWLTSTIGVPVALKLECVQRTGSFKIRGAFNALTRVAKGTRIVTASAGNHGRAIAVAAEMLGVHATVFAPRDAPRAKLAAITRHGADLRLEPTYDAAETAARAFADDTHAVFISAYNHPDIIAGAGTIALEVFEAMPTIGTLIVPVGGGGLIGGVALAAKSIAPRIRVVGVEVAASCAMLTSLRAGRITAIAPQPTLADGLAGNLEPNSMTFEIARELVDEIETVTEQELADAMRGLLGEEHVVAEGAGAVAVAALLARKVQYVGPVVALVTGANVDEERLLAALGK